MPTPKFQAHPDVSDQSSPSETTLGYSLLELMVAMVIMSLLAVQTGGTFIDVVGRYRLDAAAAEVSLLIREARMLAVSRGRPIRVLFTEVDLEYWTDGQTAGVARLEAWDPSSLSWKPVDATLPSAPGTCQTQDGRLPFCVDLKAGFAGISLVWVDPLGGSIFVPSIEFRPDGFLVGGLEAAWSRDPTALAEVVLLRKQGGGNAESRILQLDRAGWVSVLRGNP